MKKLVWVFVLTFSVNVFASGVPSMLSNFRIESGQSSRVYFDSSMPITSLTTKGFTISGKNISKIVLNSGKSSGHYIAVSKPFTFWDNNTIRLQNGDGNVSDFDLQYISNNIDEPDASSRIYYVSLSGNDKNKGTSEGAAWRTISKAAKFAKAGSTIWVKAGDYGNEKVSFKKGGTINSPIIIKGYKNIIGDLDGKMYFNYSTNSSLDSSQMPLLRGDGSGTGLSVSGDYVIVNNIQIEKYLHNFFIPSAVQGVIFDNCLGHGTKQSGYDGVNFRSTNASSRNCRVINSIAVNAGMENIQLIGSQHLISNCKSYSDLREDTDYYFSLRGNNNILRNCLAKRVENNGHNGHGLSVKSVGVTTEYNLIENCKVFDIGMPIEARHNEVQYNVFRNIKVESLFENVGDGGAIMIMNGASYNIFDKITINRGLAGIRFIASNEKSDAPTMGHDNLFKNCVFNGCLYGIQMNEDYDGQNRVVYDNTIANSIFYRNAYSSDALINNESNDSEDNHFINCIIDGYSSELKTTNAAGWDYQNSNFYRNKNYSGPSGNGNISLDPKFENAAKGNFRLKSNSPLIDKGKNLKEVKSDFDGNSRPQGAAIDLGIFEYQDNTTSSIKANAGEDVSICLGESTTLTASGGSTYKWSNGATTKSIIVSPSTTTTYTVTATEGPDSGQDSVQVEVNDVTADAGVNVTINEGESVTLSASGGDTYLWSNEETSESITVNPNTTTTYSVTVTKNGCEDTDSVVVTVNSSTSSSVTANAGEDTTIEQGESVTLTASGGSIYQWSNGETTSSITVGPSLTTTYTVTVSDGSSSDSDSVKVTVNSSKSSSITANAGEDISICKGDSTILTASGGSIYKWSNGGTTKSITINPSVTTTYTVTITEGSDTASDSVQVEVNDITADAGTNITINEGETVTLTASGGNTYLWSTGAKSKSITVSPQKTVIYSVTVYRNGCEDTDNIQVSVNQNIVTNPPPAMANAGEDVTICLGESVTLNASGGKSYLWSTGDVQKSINVSPKRTTTYTLKATRGGITDSDYILVTVENCNNISLEDNLNNDFVVYPNPTSDILNVNVTHSTNDLNLVLINLNGSIVYSDKMNVNHGSMSKQVDLSRFAKGIYFVKLFNSNQNMVKKILLI